MRLNKIYFCNKIQNGRCDTMKRVLSWVVLFLISIVVGILTSVVIEIVVYLFTLIKELNTFLKLISYLFLGTAITSLCFVPAHYGSLLAVSVSEAIKESKEGTRYIVFATYMLIVCILNVVKAFYEGTF